MEEIQKKKNGSPESKLWFLFTSINLDLSAQCSMKSVTTFKLYAVCFVSYYFFFLKVLFFWKMYQIMIIQTLYPYLDAPRALVLVDIIIVD